MTWLTINEAAKNISKLFSQREGVHIFFYPKTNFFRVVRDSRNGQYAGEYIYKERDRYMGFFSFNRYKAAGDASGAWSESEILFELLDMLECEIHNFPRLTNSIICLNNNE